MSSLRTRLLAGTIIATVIVQIAAGLAIYFFVQWSLVRQFDAAMRAMALTIQAATEQRPGGKVIVEPDATDLPDFSRKKKPDYFQLWGPDGTVLARSRSLDTGNLARVNGSENVTLPDGHRGRQI